MHLFLFLFFQVRRVKPLLTVTFLSGDISLMNNYDDLSPTIIRSGLKGMNAALGCAYIEHVHMNILMAGVNDMTHHTHLHHVVFMCHHSTDVEAQWCSQGDLLAVSGMERHGLPADSACGSMLRNALVKFYNVQGEHIYTLEMPAQVGFLENGRGGIGEK